MYFDTDWNLLLIRGFHNLNMTKLSLKIPGFIHACIQHRKITGELPI